MSSVERGAASKEPSLPLRHAKAKIEKRKAEYIYK